MAENTWVTGVISPYSTWVITPFTTGWGLPFGDHWEPVLFLFLFLFLSLAQDVPVHAHVPGAWIQKDPTKNPKFEDHTATPWSFLDYRIHVYTCNLMAIHLLVVVSIGWFSPILYIGNGSFTKHPSNFEMVGFRVPAIHVGKYTSPMDPWMRTELLARSRSRSFSRSAWRHSHSIHGQGTIGCTPNSVPMVFIGLI